MQCNNNKEKKILYFQQKDYNGLLQKYVTTQLSNTLDMSNCSCTSSNQSYVCQKE